MNMDKNYYRKEGIRLRNSLTESDRQKFDDLIMEKICSLPEWEKAENILIYCSYLTEVSTKGLIYKAFSERKKVFCPKVTDRHVRKMEFIRINSLDDLTEGFHGIAEPISSGHSIEIFEPSRYDGSCVMIMPGTAFSRRRDRIGYNGGFYDTYLNRFNLDSKAADSDEQDKSFCTIAICYSCQIFGNELPHETHDRKPEYIVTEIETIR